MDTSVLIVGAGPVGLSLAIDLAGRGIKVAIAEMRPAGERPSVKCNHVSSRTMEAFRQMGISQQVRAVGLPDDYPNDIVFRPVATGPISSVSKFLAGVIASLGRMGQTHGGLRQNLRIGRTRSISNRSCSIMLRRWTILRY